MDDLGIETRSIPPLQDDQSEAGNAIGRARPNRRTVILVVAVVAAVLVSCIATQGFGLFQTPWDVFYESRDERSGVVWIGFRNATPHLQQVEWKKFPEPYIVDAKGYKYELQPQGFSSYPERTPYSLGSSIVPPGGAFLVPYPNSMPVNAPSPRLVLSPGFLGIGAHSVPLDKPENGFRSRPPELPNSPVLLSKRDVEVRLMRAWRDDGLLILEIRITNQSGQVLSWQDLHTLEVWGSQAVGTWTGDIIRIPISEEERPRLKEKFDSYHPTTDWDVAPYTDARIQYVFVLHPDDRSRKEFTLALYSLDYGLQYLLFTGGYKFKEYHVTRVNALDAPPINDPADVPLLNHTYTGPPQNYFIR